MAQYNAALQNAVASAINATNLGRRRAAGLAEFTQRFGPGSLLVLYSNAAATQQVAEFVIDGAEMDNGGVRIGRVTGATINAAGTPSPDWRAVLRSADGTYSYGEGRVRLTSQAAFAAGQWGVVLERALTVGDSFVAGAGSRMAMPQGLDWQPDVVSAAPTVATKVTTIAFLNESATPLVTPKLSFGQPFGPNYVPSGWHVEVRPIEGASTLPTQQDQESYWPNHSNSLRMAAISFACPDTIAAGETRTYEVWAVPGAPNRTASRTLAQVKAAGDIHLRYSGGTLGADVYFGSVNHIIDNGTAWDATAGWGENPLMGHEVVRSGPLCTEWRLFTHARRSSDGAFHRWIQATFYLIAWNDGTIDLMSNTRMVGLSTPNPNATAGPAAAIHQEYEASLRNGATVIREFGGINDARYLEIQPTAFSVADNKINLGAHKFAYMGSALRFEASAGGALPAGINAGQVYFWNGSRGGLSATRGNSFRESDTLVDFTSQGTGTIKVIPMVGTWMNQGWFGARPDGRRDRIGAPTPEVLVIQDFAYTARKSRALPAYMDGVVVTDTFPAYPFYATGNYGPIQADMNAQGDSPDDDRIGWMGNSEAMSFFNQKSSNLAQRVRAVPFWWLDMKVFHQNEKTGRFGNFSNNAYAGLGTPLPDFRYFGLGDDTWGTPKHIVVHENDQSGYWNRYAVEIDGSHLPTHWYMAYLRHADIYYHEIGVAIMTSMHNATAMIRNFAHLGAQYRAVYAAPKGDQDRGTVWQLRHAGQVEHVTPAASVYRDYVSNETKYALQAWKLHYDTLPIEQRNMGYIQADSTNGSSSGIANAYATLVTGMLRWQGVYQAEADNIWAHVRKCQCEALDEDIGGWLPHANNYYVPVFDGSTRIASWPQYWARFILKAAGTRLIPEGQPWVKPAGDVWLAGSVGTVDANHIAHHYGWGTNDFSAITAAGLALHARAGDAQAAKVGDRIRARRWPDTAFRNQPKVAITRF